MSCEICHGPNAQRTPLKQPVQDRTFIDLCETCFRIIKRDYGPARKPQPAPTAQPSLTNS